MSDTTPPPASPYQGLEGRAFWRAGVVAAGSYPPPDIYRPKFDITREMPIFTAGSCFAQHVGRTLAQAGYSVIDSEPLPAAVPPELANRFFDTLNIQKGVSKLLIDFPTALLQIIFGLLLLSLYHPFFIVYGVLLLALIYVVFKYTITLCVCVSGLQM